MYDCKKYQKLKNNCQKMYDCKKISEIKKQLIAKIYDCKKINSHKILIAKKKK